MNLRIGMTLLSAGLVAACQAAPTGDGGSNLADRQQAGPTRVQLRLVRDNRAAAGLAVRALDEASRELGEGVTAADGVVQVELSRAGDGWLVAHDGQGQGIVLRYTAQAAGLNDLGERAMGELAEQPDVLAFRGLGFEERVTTDPALSVLSFALADEGRVAVVLVGGPGVLRLVRINLETREAQTVRDPAPAALSSIDQRYVAWRERPVDGAERLVVYDAIDSSELSNFELQVPQGSSIGAMWSTSVGHVSVLLAPDELWGKAVGLAVTALGVTRVDLGSADHVRLGLSSGQLWLQELDFSATYSNELTLRDAATFAERGRWNLGRNGQVLVAGDTCAIVKTPDGIGRVRQGAELSMLSTASPESSLGASRASGRFAQWVDEGGQRRLATASCTEPLITHAVDIEGEDSTAKPYVDASADDVVRLVARQYEGGVAQMKIWEWRPGQPTASRVYASPFSSQLQYDNRFTLPLVLAPPLEASQAQWWVGLPSRSTPRTWVRQKRAWPELSADHRRLVYLMDDPVLESQQLFTLEVKP